jgi:hypothetical protein
MLMVDPTGRRGRVDSPAASVRFLISPRKLCVRTPHLTWHGHPARAFAAPAAGTAKCSVETPKPQLKKDLRTTGRRGTSDCMAKLVHKRFASAA